MSVGVRVGSHRVWAWVATAQVSGIQARRKACLVYARSLLVLYMLFSSPQRITPAQRDKVLQRVRV